MLKDMINSTGANAAPAKITRALEAIVRVIRATLQTRSTTYLQLYMRARRTPYYVPGTFRFPFGRVRYVDIGSLPFLYFEIFIDRVYDLTDIGDTPRIYDCGGNIGMGTIWFKNRYPGARVTTFEADPTIAQVLDANVRSLRLDRVDVIQAAVAATTGTVTFQTDGAIGGRIGGETGLPVTCVRLSDHIAEPVDLLKLDIEGSEFDVITDLCVTGKIDLIRHIVCEVHARRDTQDKLADLWSNLTRAGFQLTINWAKAATDAPDAAHPTPFYSVTSAEFVALLYAWRD